MPHEVKSQTNRPPKPEPPDAGHIPMTEEMDAAKWSLPPIVPVLIALGIVAVVVALYTWHGTTVPRPNGKLRDVVAAEQKSESAGAPAESRVLVAVQLSMTNPTDRPVHVQGASAEVQAEGQNALKDDAAASSDFERYALAFPELKQAASTPLKLETKIMPGETVNGTVMFGFPLSKDAFDKKKSMKVWVKLYDYDRIEIKQ
jgi:hypothetical protein